MIVVPCVLSLPYVWKKHTYFIMYMIVQNNYATNRSFERLQFFQTHPFFLDYTTFRLTLQLHVAQIFNASVLLQNGRFMFQCHVPRTKLGDRAFL